jgi:hypothetical protein
LRRIDPRGSAQRQQRGAANQRSHREHLKRRLWRHPANVSTVPASVFAEGGTRQSIVTVTNITDAQGRRVPDGTRVVVSTLGGCFHRDPGGNCINSAGETIAGGDGSPELGDARMRVFTVTGGTITFSFQPSASGTSVLQLLPAAPNGVRIGNQTFAIKTVSITP